MRRKKPDTKNANRWEPAHLQAIFFPIASPREIQQDWFRELTGQAAKESIARPHELVQVGPFGNCVLNLNVDLLRIIFTLQPQVDTDATEMFPTLGDSLRDSVNLILDLADRWARGYRIPIKRAAFAGRLIQRTRSKATGYRLLRQYLPTVKLDSSSSDLMFRINRPRVLKSVSRSTLNRLSTWTLAKQIKLAQAFSADAAPVSSPSEEAFACALDFDVNTPAERAEPLPQNRLKRILKELASASLEIAERGDVR